MTWFFELLKAMSPQIAQALKDGLQRLLQKLYDDALETENGWDDWGIKMIAKVVDVELIEPPAGQSPPE